MARDYALACDPMILFVDIDAAVHLEPRRAERNQSSRQNTVNHD